MVASFPMHTLPQVGIIVLNYNGKHCLLPCLQSLDRLTYANKDIIVVDNGSLDDSLAVAEKQFPHFTFVRNEKNEGFAKGMNIGMRLALARGATWCWVFNYDAIAAPDSLSRLIAVTEEYPRAGLLSPLISVPGSDCHWFAKGRIDFFRMRTVHIEPTATELQTVAYPSEFLTGCALLIKKELIDAAGLLDENFFLYYEDADYSIRALRSGFALLVVPSAHVSHSEVSRSHPKKTYFLVYSGLLFFAKWASPVMRPYLFVYVTMRRVKNFLKRRSGSVAAEETHRAYRKYFYER